MLSLSFFFYCYRDHRDLHSFPTRRSSDLLLWPRDASSWLVVFATGPVVASVDHPGVDVRADRKSTRLNSSHRCISYAVFCLKKKTPIVGGALLGISRDRAASRRHPEAHGA